MWFSYSSIFIIELKYLVIEKEKYSNENNIVRVSFEKILNVDSNIIAEYLAKYLDYHLKKTQQDESQME